MTLIIHNLESNCLKQNKFNIFLYSQFFLRLVIILNLFMWTGCDKKHGDLIAPGESEFPGTPKNVIVKVGDKQIALFWEMSNSKNIKYYHIFRKDLVFPEMNLIDSCFTMQYIDTNVKNGVLYFYQISAVDSQDYEGKRSKEVVARSNVFDVIIENGSKYTKSQSVSLKLTALPETKYMLIANDSSFNNASWESFAPTRNWTLSSGDGEKHVYAKFRDNEGNETLFSAHDMIILDTRATINQVKENTQGQMKVPGQIIHFVLIAGEPEGKATIDIGIEKQGIKLYDDASKGDPVAEDGTYEIDYLIPSDLEAINAIIMGHFTDRVGNVADDVTATGRVTIQQAPAPVNLSLSVLSGTSEKSLELYWSQSSDNDFSSYRLFKSTTAGVDTSCLLVTTIAEKTTTKYNDTNVIENKDYFYRVFVYDKFGLAKGSNEVVGQIDADDPPTPVILYPPSPAGNSLTSLTLNWSQNDDNDFASYKIFRARIPGVDSTSLLVTTISEQSTANYEDANLEANTEYYYRIYVYDTGGLSAGSNEEMGRTNANEPPTPVYLYPLSPIANSLTSLSLSWSKNDDSDFASYKIYRTKAPGVDSTAVLVTTISDQSTTNYEDIDLRENTAYYYRIYVYDSGGLSAGSNEEMGKTNANQPPQPVILYPLSPIANSLTSLSLSWSKNDDNDFANYKIYRTRSPGVDSTSLLVTTISDQNTTNYEDTNLRENTEYYYKVYVYDTRGLSAGSTEEMGKTNANQPPSPVILAKPSVVDSMTLHLSWSQNSDDDFAMYSIYRSETSPVDTTNAPITIINNQQTTHYDDNKLSTNTAYFYRVFVEDQGGLFSGSKEVSGTPKP